MEKKENAGRRIFRAMLLAALVVAAFLITGKGTVKVQAAGYVSMRNNNIGHNHGNELKTKSGKYYFKLDNNYNVYISTSKNGPYRETPLRGMGFVSNGKQAYYIKDSHYLYRYVYASGESYYIEDLPTHFGVPSESYSVDAVQGNKLYLTNGTESSRNDTYIYNIKRGKFRLLQRNCGIIDRYKNYVISLDYNQTGMGPTSYTLYRLSASGLQKIKNITSHGYFANFADGSLYYDIYDSSGNPSFTFYRCRPNGTGIEKIHHIEGSSGLTYMSEFTSKYCEYYVNGYKFRYTYATGKITSVPR